MPDGLHGRLPAHDRQGHLHHQRHRACRRLAAGPLARASTSTAPSTRRPTRTSTAARSSRRRGAWLEFEIDKRDSVGVRIDRKRKQAVTVLLKALGWTSEQILERVRRVRVDARHPGEGPHGRPGRRAARHLPQAAPGRAADQGVRADAAGEPATSTPSATTSPRSAATRSTRSSGSTAEISQGTLTEDDIVATIEYIVRLHAGEESMPAPRGPTTRRRDRRHRPLRQPSSAHRRRAHPEPGPHWAWPVWSASSASG